MNDEIRRNLALFPIGIVQKLTDLTARQIRYYEQHHLIQPARTEGNQRLFSFNDVEQLLQIKDLIDQGVNIAGIKKVLQPQTVPSELPSKETAMEQVNQIKDLSDRELHALLKKELVLRGRPGNQGSLIQGELSRFFH